MRNERKGLDLNSKKKTEVIAISKKVTHYYSIFVAELN